ncbi:MBL fold metallo-hydrolase [Muricoccus pecuniae]|uniref:Glyoxylase-like metal-dependent hydrolase (Beta-lactamase superfamily II) n=1 Tax=Muricoccus pecuniae TaxID=693023 RepID=A0A840YKM6_9PROT|nr:MBL fold metallo-hydrolase [Roseomonas pecuniae]MBB5694774.1 glyoxylase-like metal-dependent hydrolase (beta-lactamase superfamily II) [Roseomonas pecuniae]
MSPDFRRDDPLRPGEVEWIAPGLRRIICANPGPFTYRGTNTYLIGRGSVAVLDPGPDDPAHRAVILAALAGERVRGVLVSHTHRDHSPGAAPLAAATGAETLGFGPHLTPAGAGGEGGDHAFLPDRRLADGEGVEGDGWRLTALRTPGHCANHLCFALEAERELAPAGVLFSADHVMSWSTSVVSPPDGDMADYMRSLRRVAAREDRLLLPGHGPAHDAPGPFIAALIAHREEREARVLEALRRAGRPVDAPALVPAVYGPALDPGLAPAAARSLLAHLVKLAGEGLAMAEGELFRAV